MQMKIYGFICRDTNGFRGGCLIIKKKKIKKKLT